MALQLIEGFDHYGNIADFLTRWSGGSTGSLAIATGRFGAGTGNALEINNASGQGFWYRDFTAIQEFICGFAFRTSTLSPTDPSIIYWGASGEGPTCGLSFNSSGQIRAHRGSATEFTLGTSTATILANEWNFLESKWKIDGSVGTVQVWLNGVSILNLTGQNTQRYGHANVSEQIAYGPNSSGTKRYDDYYFADLLGGVNDAALGDVRVKFIKPTGVGNSDDWVASAGAGWECVDEVGPDGDTSYIATASVNDKDLFTLENLGLTDVVLGVDVIMQARKDDATVRELVPVVRTGGTDYEGANKVLATTYGYHNHIWDKNPGTSAAWTKSEVDALEAGVKLDV